MRMFFTVAFTLAFSVHAYAASTTKVPARRPASEIQRLVALIRLGERQTRFEVAVGSDGKIKLTSANSMGRSTSRDLTRADLEYISNQFDGLPVPDKIPDVCYRSRVEIVVQTPGGGRVRKASCLGLRTITEPAFRHFVNLLAIGS